MSESFLKSMRLFLTVLLLIIGLNVLSGFYSFRIDLTEEKRYTLTPQSEQMLRNLKENVVVEVFLEGKDLPAGIRKVSNHTRDLLQDMRRISGGKLQFVFTDLNEITNTGAREARQKEIVSRGLLPVNLEVDTESGYSEKLIFPGAILSAGEKGLAITILENQMLQGAQGAMDNSLTFLEYKLVNAIHKLQQERMPKVAFLQGHGEVGVRQVADFVEALARQNFDIDKLELGKDPLLDGSADVLIVAKPTQPFSETDKFLLDQYVMQGGKVLWLVDEVIADMDSFQLAPSIFSIPRDLNLQDLLFRYGVRINYDLVQDLYSVPVPIVEEIAGNPQPKLYPWVFYPLIRGTTSHPIVKNLDPVLFRFASSIDTIKSPGVTKTVLLSSSDYSRTQKIPFQIYLEGARQKPLPALFNRKAIPVAMLLEGEFTSHYGRRADQSMREAAVRERSEILTSSKSTKMIVVSDGDIMVNDLDPSGRPAPLGFYRFTRETYANRDFLLNCVEYLLDDAGLIAARNRDIRMRLLDKAAVNDQRMLWQTVTVAGPIPLLLLFGVGYNRRRKQKYATPKSAQ
jgi:ABC-2 type transport system permease protein